MFRYFLSPAAAFDRSAPQKLRAVRGVVASVLGMLEGGVTHLGVATDHVIESFRNALWPVYKTGEGMDPLLYAQFQPLEDALSALGVVVWPMVEFEADDALAVAAVMAAADAHGDQVVVCTPDKDLAQCVRGDRIVQLDRRTRELRNESAVRPSTPRAHSEAGHGGGRVRARGDAAGDDACRATRARSCSGNWPHCVRTRPSAPAWTSLRWTGPRPDFAAWSERLGTKGLLERASPRAAVSRHHNSWQPPGAEAFVLTARALYSGKPCR